MSFESSLQDDEVKFLPNMCCYFLGFSREHVKLVIRQSLGFHQMSFRYCNEKGVRSDGVIVVWLYNSSDFIEFVKSFTTNFHSCRTFILGLQKVETTRQDVIIYGRNVQLLDMLTRACLWQQ